MTTTTETPADARARIQSRVSQNDFAAFEPTPDSVEIVTPLEVISITTREELEAVFEAIIDAASHYADLATMKSSATLCISDARKCMNVGRYENAIGRATRSLAYSLGVFDEVYLAASDAVTAAEEARHARTLKILNDSF